MDWTILCLNLSGEQEVFFFSKMSRLALSITQPPVPYVPGCLSSGVKRPGLKADHIPPSSTEVKSE
jgi:hypothetical protein